MSNQAARPTTPAIGRPVTWAAALAGALSEGWPSPAADEAAEPAALVADPAAEPAALVADPAAEPAELVAEPAAPEALLAASLKALLAEEATPL